MKDIINIDKNGVLGVEIKKNKYGIDLFITRNGEHWSGFEVNSKLLKMMRDSIDEYLRSDEHENP